MNIHEINQAKASNGVGTEWVPHDDPSKADPVWESFIDRLGGRDDLIVAEAEVLKTLKAPKKALKATKPAVAPVAKVKPVPVAKVKTPKVSKPKADNAILIWVVAIALGVGTAFKAVFLAPVRIITSFRSRKRVTILLFSLLAGALVFGAQNINLGGSYAPTKELPMKTQPNVSPLQAPAQSDAGAVVAPATGTKVKAARKAVVVTGTRRSTGTAASTATAPVVAPATNATASPAPSTSSSPQTNTNTGTGTGTGTGTYAPPQGGNQGGNTQTSQPPQQQPAEDGNADGSGSTRPGGANDADHGTCSNGGNPNGAGTGCQDSSDGKPEGGV